MTNPIDALLAEKGVLLADGATGTNLFAMGLAAGEAPELWNEDDPDKITALHQGFVDAGACIVGGCCGTSFEHLKAMRDALDTHTRGDRPTIEAVVEKIGPMRNKAANESGAPAGSERRERRRSRA